MTTNKYDWTNKDKIISDLKESCSTSEFLDKNGLVCSSGNYDTFKKWLKFHNIKKEEYFKPKEKPLVLVKSESLDKSLLTKEEVLCQNSIYTRKDANRIIRNENLLPYECNGCGNKGEWNGKTLTLQLEHKNGDSCDHRIENLEYLCPNCHSQTNTYGSKNKHNRIFEERIKDILEYDNIGRKEIELLAAKWSIAPVTVKFWLNQYKLKIINTKQIIFNWHSEVEVSECTKIRLQQLNKVNVLDKSWKKELEKLWNLSDNGVKKWIKKNAPDFFKNNYILTPSYKAKLKEEELYMNIKRFLDEFKLNNKFELDKIYSHLYCSQKMVIIYLRNKFLQQYNYFNPIPNCPECDSSSVNRFGLRRLKSGNIQRYKCNDCSKQFYENN